jgi:hypothetical protein
MFYFLVSRLPLISQSTEENKLARIYFIGSVCYIVLHAILFSNIGDNVVLIQNYRSYLYYLWGIDFLLTGGYMKLFGNNNLIHEESEESASNNKLSDSDQEKLEQAKENNSTFIKIEKKQKQEAQDDQKDKSDSESSKSSKSKPEKEPNKQEIMSDTQIPEYQSQLQTQSK